MSRVQFLLFPFVRIMFGREENQPPYLTETISNN